MKKIQVFIITGVFIIITAILCISENVTYAKSKHFNTPEETIKYFTSSQLNVADKRGGYVETETLKECISKRKILYGSNVDWVWIKFKEKNLLTDSDEERILKDYKSRIANIEGYEIPNECKSYSFIGEGKNINYERVGGNSKYKFDIVLIDEGEGYVIDYFIYSELKDNAVGGDL